MAKFKEKMKEIWTWVWECLKHSFIPLIMYITMSIVLFMFTLNEQEWELGLTTGRFWWCFGIALAVVAYNGFTAFLEGGNGYDMLVTGNLKRNSGDIKMSAHKEQKEYRAWKGFAFGAIASLITIIGALVLAGNQAAVDQIVLTDKNATIPGELRPLLTFAMLIWGWANLPFMFANAGGVFVSYYWILLIALLPVVVSGVFYIVGAYARRHKRLTAQEAEEAAEAAAANEPKKVNYGGLPGTKPNKKK